MTRNVVNLNRFRKARDRAAEDKQAADNRVKFGRAKAEKQAAKAEAERVARLHEALRLEGDEPPAGAPPKDRV